MVPSVLITAAWIIIGIRCGLRFFNLLNHRSKDWLEILFNLSFVVLALAFLL